MIQDCFSDLLSLVKEPGDSSLNIHLPAKIVGTLERGVVANNQRSGFFPNTVLDHFLAALLI